MAQKLSRKQHFRQQQAAKTPMLIIGGGLIVLALALVVTFIWQGAASPAQNQKYGTIPVEVNYAAPVLALESMSGKQESLADYRDRVVLVNNWATWCPPCKAEMPTLVEYYKAHAAEGFMIVAVDAGDSKDEVAKFVEQYKMPFAVWLDPDGDSVRAFSNNSLPNSYVIDRNGQVRLAWTGEITLDMLEQFVTPLLSE